MRPLLQNIIAYVLALVARVLTPAFQRQIARLCMHVVGDVPDLDGARVVNFQDPTPSGRSRKRKIDASLQQFGRYVWGTGHVHGMPGDLFLYRGTIKRNAFYGSFRRVDSHILAGTGTFVLQISADSCHMDGHCSWYDNLLDDVWSSEYAWTRSETGTCRNSRTRTSQGGQRKKKGLALR